MICTFCREEKCDNFYKGRAQCKPCRIWIQQCFDKGDLTAYHERLRKICDDWHNDYVLRECWKSREGNWRPVYGYFGLYEISDKGQVSSLWFKNINSFYPRVTPKLLSLYENEFGYKSFNAVGEDGSRSTTHVHRALLLSFSGPSSDPSKTLVAHGDGIGSNNCLENLRWASYSENEDDKRRHGRSLTGSKNHQSKLNERTIVLMRYAREKKSKTYQEIGDIFGVSRSVAHRICTRKAWRHVA